MSISHRDYEEDRPSTRNGKWRRRPTRDALFLSQLHGGEPEDYMGNAAFPEWTDKKLTEAGFHQTAIYRYSAENGTVLYEVLRYEHHLIKGEKRFTQRMPSGAEVADVAFYRTAGYVKVIYNWPEVAARKDEPVVFTEGEKDADRLMSLGMLATTIAGQNWTETCVRALIGRDVIILEDNDDEGRENAEEAVKQLDGRARSLKVVRLPGLPKKGDVSDWLDAGHTQEEFLEISANTRECRAEGVIVAEPHSFPNADEIPMWDFLYAKHLLRGTVSLTAATGGTGKSSLAIVEALAMTAGRPLLTIQIAHRLRVLLINLEDDRNTMNKRILAVMKRYGIAKEEVGNRLFIIAKGETKLKMARYGKFKVVELNEELIAGLIEFVKANRIDVVSVDPFVKTHSVSENDNIDIETVVEAFDDIAETGQCAVHIWHHTTKMRGESATVESARGAKSLTDTVRSARILQTMTKEEASKLNIAEPGFYFCSFSGKRNFAPPSEARDWYQMVSVDIENSALFGDEVGVVTPWAHPGTDAARLSEEELERVKAKVRAGRWREDMRADAWVGKVIADALGWDLAKSRVTIQTLVGTLIGNGTFHRVQGRTGEYKNKIFVEVNE